MESCPKSVIFYLLTHTLTQDDGPVSDEPGQDDRPVGDEAGQDDGPVGDEPGQDDRPVGDEPGPLCRLPEHLLVVQDPHRHPDVITAHTNTLLANV